jgi:hypothetical protein
MSNLTTLPGKVIKELSEVTKEYQKDFPEKKKISDTDMYAILFIWVVREIVKLREKFD